jgi:putative salt-induced outer membrane protein YdiY
VSVASADQITAKNGDRITGSIVKKDEKTISMKTDVFGLVTVPWDQVQTVSAEQPVNVVLSTGETLRGTLTPREQRVEIDASGTRREVALADITTLRDAAAQREYERLMDPRVRDLWAGTATLGFAGTQGNAKTRTLTTGLNAARVTNSDKAILYFNAIRASAVIDGISANTAQAVRGGLGYSRNISTRLFVNGFNDYEYDRFQNLDLRFVLGGGLGFIAWKGENGRLDLLGGGAYNRESFAATASTPGFTRNSGEAYFGDDFTYKLTAVTSLYQNLRYFPNLSNTGDYRLNFDLGATTKLAGWLVWNLAVSDRLLSNPVPGRQKNDLLYSTSIGVTFAR